VDEIFPQFADQVLVLSKALDQFDRNVVMGIGTIRPEGDESARRSGTGIQIAAQSLVTDWTNFVRMFRKLMATNKSAYFPVLAEGIKKLTTAINEVGELFRIGKYKTVLPQKTLEGVSLEISELKHIAPGEMDPDALRERVEELMKVIWDTLLKSGIPRKTMDTAIAMREKMELKMRINEVLGIVNAYIDFDQAVANVNRAANELNEELSALFRVLNLPYRFKINEPFENEDLERSKELHRLRLNTPK
jgi:hypothetical protein